MLTAELVDLFSILQGLFTESAQGSGRLSIVTGGLASGKTLLMDQLLDACTSSGALVLSATGSRAERPLQGSVIDQLLSSGDPRASTAGDAGGTTGTKLWRPPADRPAAGSVEAGAAALMQQFVATVLEQARERPVVIAVDDIHYSDTLSLQALLYLRRRIRSARVFVVLNMWERPQPALSAFCSELARLPCVRLGLAPLSQGAITELAAQSLGAAAGAQLAPALLALTKGNPMLVTALIEDHRAGSSQEGSPLPGPAFGRAVLDCLHRWEPELLEFCGALAVLGEHASAALATELLGMTAEYARDAVTILGDAGLVENGQLRHCAVRAALIGNLAPAQRSRMHLQAAAVLYQRGAAATDVAEHFAAAERVQGSWSVAVMREAARQALADDRSQLASRYLELALQGATDEAERKALGESLAMATWRIQPSVAVRSLSPAPTAGRPDATIDGDPDLMVRHGLWTGNAATVRQALRHAERSGRFTDPRTNATIRLLLQWYYGPSGGPAEGEEGDCRAYLGAAPESDDPWTIAADALTALWESGADPASSACAEHLLRSCRLGDDTIEVLAIALLALAQDNRAADAAAWCERLIREATRRGGVTWHAWLLSIRAEIALWQGEPALAETHAQAALSLLRPREWGVNLGHPVMCLLLAHAARGHRDQGTEMLARLVPDAALTTVVGVRYLHARGRYFLSSNRALAATTDFRTCLRMMAECRLHVSALISVDSDLAEANLRLGHVVTAREMVFRQIEETTTGPRNRGMSLRVLAACSEPAIRPALLEEAERYLVMAGDQLGLADVRRDLRRAHQELDCPVVMACAGEGSPPAGGAPAPAPPDESQLSEAERRVALLAASGHPNREIGRRLWITVSTVEQHLTRVYRKLGVKRRSDLRSALSEADPVLVHELGPRSA